MKLHWSPRSPFVRKVMIVAHELGVAGQITCVRTVVAAAAPNETLRSDNPQSRLPTLVLDDGRAIYDSRVIAEYLDGLDGRSRLFPQEPQQRLVALRRQALGDGMLDTLLLWLGERNRPASAQSERHIAAWETKTRWSLDALEQESPALARDEFSIGHVSLGVALGYLDFRFPALQWREARPGLSEWHAAFDARPSVRANLPADDS
jgi:glutathione S-transferase